MSDQNFEIDIVEQELIDVDIVDQELIDVDIVDQELIDVDIVDQEILDVELVQVDVVTQQTVVNIYFADNEIPTPVGAYPTARFRTAYVYKTGTLKVYLNGLKQIATGSIIIHDNREFSIDQSIPSDWDISVDYTKE